MANASDQAFLMKGYLRGGDPPMLLASLFLPTRVEFVSSGRVIAAGRVSVMAAAEEDVRDTPLFRGSCEEAWKP